MKKSIKNRRGFTLIELMIVIVIIGLLASIVTFQYTKIRNDVRRKACQATMKRLYEAGQQYLFEHQKTPDTYHQITAKILFKSGYLKRMPKCPIHTNRYAISGEEEGKIKVHCFNPINSKIGHGKFMLNDR